MKKIKLKQIFRKIFKSFKKSEKIKTKNQKKNISDQDRYFITKKFALMCQKDEIKHIIVS